MKPSTNPDEAFDKNTPLPHETDQNPDSQAEHESRDVGGQRRMRTSKAGWSIPTGAAASIRKTHSATNM